MYSHPCSSFLLQGVRDAVSKVEGGFYTMFEVTSETVGDILQEWLKSKPLGALSPELEGAILQDIEGDVVRFIDAIGASHVTLRLVLDTSSGFEEFYSLRSNPLIASDTLHQVNAVAAKLEYDSAYLFHADEDVVNQVKSYAGATTLGLDSADLVDQPDLVCWFEIFADSGGLREAVSDALAQGDVYQLHRAIQLSMARVHNYQLSLPGLLKPGKLPFQFLEGAPHVYFGAPEQLAGRGHALPKPILHAKPLIWTEEHNAKRFLTLLDSPRGYSIR
jgi:hypothetical protein